jgi:hypothetical protein
LIFRFVTQLICGFSRPIKFFKNQKYEISDASRRSIKELAPRTKKSNQSLGFSRILIFKNPFFLIRLTFEQLSGSVTV